MNRRLGSYALTVLALAVVVGFMGALVFGFTVAIAVIFYLLGSGNILAAMAAIILLVATVYTFFKEGDVQW